MSSNVKYFAEESCWDGETFRSVRREIVFVICGHAIQTGKPIRHEFRADFGLWYDYEDELLIQILTNEIAGVDWGWYVFHKKMDHSAILIINPDTGKVAGSIYPRGARKRKPSGEILPEGVTPIAKGLEYRAKRLQKQEKRREANRTEN